MIDTDDFEESLMNYKSYVITRAGDNLKNIGNEILEKSRNKAPIDLGILREDSGYNVKNNEAGITLWIGFLEFYAVYQHQGTGLFALNGNGRKTPWWWKGTTEKWEGWHRTVGVKPKQFLWDTLVNYIEIIPEMLGEGI